jgi:phosphoribosyl 1,2-cyclic phosphodiesterase
MKIKLWGTRGSLPASSQPEQNFSHIKKILNNFVTSEFFQTKDIDNFLLQMPFPQIAGYGGATVCVEVQSLHSNQNIIIDGGSGLKPCGDQLMASPLGKGKGVAHIFLTHFHWDHLIGLPFFVPLFIPGNEIHFHAVQKDLGDNIRELFKKPKFPVPFEKLAANIHFHRLEPRCASLINDITITPYELDHPDPCWGFRVQVKDKVYAHCVDTEGTRMSIASLGPDLEFYQKVDLMCYDAQYSLHDLSDKINWGHSAAEIGLDLAMREGVKHILFVHHEPTATIDQIEHIISKTRDYYDWKLEHAKELNLPIYPSQWGFGYDGQIITL